MRPSFVLGGRAMAIVYDEATLDDYMRTAVDASPERPILIDKFLERAAEFDVDALADETACIVAGLQEHIEEAGIHSGDSSCVLPPVRVAEEHLETMRHYTRTLAQALKVRGLINIQFAIKDDRVYVLEVNPRASRTVPFVSKATGVPLARIDDAVARIKHGMQRELRLGNLDARRDWGYAADYVEAMWLMMQAKAADDYVIATGVTHSVRDFLDAAFGHLDLDWQDYVEIDPRYYRPAEVDLLQGDASKARKQLGWQPKVSFPEMVKLMVNHDLELAQHELRQQDSHENRPDASLAQKAGNQ